MLRSLFGISKPDPKFRNTLTILNQLYLLTFSGAKHTSQLEILVKEHSGKFNEHELAIIFLASFSSHIKLDHPRAEIEVKKYISRAKGTYDRGLAHDPMPKEYLFSVASERFGIDSGTIEAI